MQQSGPSRPKPRPIVRLGIVLISHSVLVSVLCCVAGIIALLLLPMLAQNNHVSENALMPGSPSSMLSNQDVLDANKLVNDLSDLRSKLNNAEKAKSWLHSTFQNWVQKMKNFSASGINVVVIVKAPQGDGKESIVLVTPYDTAKIRDIGNTHKSLHGYKTIMHLPFIVMGWDILIFSMVPRLCDGGKDNFVMDKWSLSDGLRRAGTMAIAFVVTVTDDSELCQDILRIYAEAFNGQMPNCDLINNYLALHKQGLHVNERKFLSLSDAKWLEFIGKVLESVRTVARRLNPQWKFGIPAADYVDGTAALASSLYHQALGVPTGSQGAFRDYQVDVITLEFSSTHYYSWNRGALKDFIMRVGRLIEGVVRSVNNLLEKFHHSFFLYLLTSPGKFVSVVVYMISFAPLVAPLQMVAAALYAEANKTDTSMEDDQESSRNSLKNDLPILRSLWVWLKAAKRY